MPTLREFAKGKPCYVRAPECRRTFDHTVLCHIRRGGVAGGGQKPVDLIALPGCDICNAIMDGDHKSEWTRTEIDAAILKGYVQWIDFLVRHEIALVCL